MKNVKMLAILVLAWGLTVLSSVALGDQYLTVNGQDVDSITLEQGQSCTVEVVSTDSTPYMSYLSYVDPIVLGDLSHLETKPEAGNLAGALKGPYGYTLSADGDNPSPSAGVHFVFLYTATQVGEAVLTLYNVETFSTDFIEITVLPLQPVPMGTVFTYLGRLMDTNSPADGIYDFQFKLFDHPDSAFAAQQGNTNDINDLDVIDGYFTVELDFGSDVFNGDARWLDIGIRPGDSNDPNAFVSMRPRQEITSVPYALQTRGIFVDSNSNVGIGTTSPEEKLDVLGNLKLTGDVYLTKPSGQGGGELVLSTAAYNEPGRYRIRFSNNALGVFTGDDTQNQEFSFISKWGAIRDYDARLSIHGKAGGSWGTYIALTHDGNDGLIETDVGDIVLSPAGNVGIGTTNPDAGLHLKGTGYPSSFMFLESDSGQDTGIRLNKNGDVRHHIFNDNSLADALRIAPEGNYSSGGITVGQTGDVGISTTSPSYRLHVNGSFYATTVNTGQGNYELYAMNQNVRTTDSPSFNRIHLSDYGTALGGFHVGGTSDPGTDNLIVDGQVGVGIGATSPSDKLDIRGDEVRIWDGTANVGWAIGEGELYVEEDLEVDGRVFILDAYNTGVSGGRDLYVGSNGELGYNTSSRRYKENIAPLEDNFLKILKAQPVTYTAKDSKEQGLGFIAEDLDKLGLNNLVIYDNQGRPESVRYDCISLYLLEVIKGQNKSLKDFRAKNESLEQRLKALERTVQQLSQGKDLEL